MLGSIYMGFTMRLFIEVPPSLDVSIDLHLCLRLRVCHHLWKSCPGSFWSCLTWYRRCVMLCAIFCYCIVIFTFGALWCAHYILYIYMLNYLDTYTWCFYVSSSFKTYTNLHQSLDCCCKQNCIQFCSFCDCSPKGPAMSCQYHLCIRVMSCGFPLSSRQHRQHGNLNPPDTSMTHLPPQRK